MPVIRFSSCAAYAAVFPRGGRIAGTSDRVWDRSSRTECEES